MAEPAYLRRNQAADYLQERYGFGTTETLAKLACIGGGPRFRKLGRFPVYTADDLQAWADSRLSDPVASTSEYAEQRRQHVIAAS
ncbi:DNA-binding protein [Sphingopyxis sp. RIFCSPHIGHO2_12_FULL_65_19]|uniref:DNA-binding protein n=1 Tax=Sphingopyxis sp. RIFCSPHIGHO2_12_FULL_65_19 TaxID=1802172 RepID=UPI0008CD29A9|nr:DNA-binding protein [Sphingopyxis sp. RIFCSPHIGHO2_12_FULL_65_19]OHD05060.1 MAG: hypothetical protein A3E77_17460 [Sphingopyxis sp. RIFCSPHIGHO2_12_FULL_65_19]